MYVSNFNVSTTFKDVSNTLQNFTFMGTTVFEIAGSPPLVKGVGTKRLGKEGSIPPYCVLENGDFEILCTDNVE